MNIPEIKPNCSLKLIKKSDIREASNPNSAKANIIPNEKAEVIKKAFFLLLKE